jgi:hypothetical protein
MTAISEESKISRQMISDANSNQRASKKVIRAFTKYYKAKAEKGAA